MIRWVAVAVALLGACGQQTAEQPFAPVAGAILSIDTGDPAVADRAMAGVQQALREHPDWARQMMSHGAEPPSGYFFKLKGRCAALSPAGLGVRRLLRDIARGPVRCEDVAP